MGREKYYTFILNGIQFEQPNPIEIGKNCGIIGCVDFKKHINYEYLDDELGHREQPELRNIRTENDPEKIIAFFCSVVEQDRDVICKKGKSSVERAMLMEILHRFTRLNQPEIGNLMGNVDYSTVSVARKRFRLKMDKDLKLKTYFENILDDLSSLKI